MKVCDKCQINGVTRKADVEVCIVFDDTYIDLCQEHLNDLHAFLTTPDKKPAKKKAA